MFGLPWDQTLAAMTFIGMIVFLFLGFPVAFSLTFTGLVFGLIGFGASFFDLLPLRIWGTMTNFTLTAVPLFVFMGVALEKSGLAEELLETMALVFGKLRGGIAISVVVVGAEFGHGKRNHVLSDYTFAVRDETTGELLPIGKAYSGLTDVEIAELTEYFKQNTIVDHGRYREVKPDIVLEVAFNAIQPSTRHASGLALRFPRIKAIRRDKNVDAIDTLTYARELAAQQARADVDLEKENA